VVGAQACSEAGSPSAEGIRSTSQAIAATTDPIPCAAASYAVASKTGPITLNAASLVDSYQSSAGGYGGQNVGEGAIVQAAGTINNTGGVVKGVQRSNTTSAFPAIPVPPGATNLPLGSSAPGALNINIPSDSITLAPGNYVVANLNVNFQGAIKVAPAGQVRIWVTGTLNLGGNENLNGAPRNLAFIVTSSGTVNVNSNGSLFGSIYAPNSSVSVNSRVFGSVIGASVTLNSQAAVHFDQSTTCTQTTPGATPFGPSPLPAPPAQPGCYMGSLRGWLRVACKDPKDIFPGFSRLNISHQGLGSEAFVSGDTILPATPLVYGQVETTVESIESETDSALMGAGWGVQNNSNSFSCAGNTAQCAAQFAALGDGVDGKAAACIETWQIPNLGGSAAATVKNFCVAADGTVSTGDVLLLVNSRKGPLKAGDFGNVAGYSFTTAGTPMIGLVAQFSWVSDQDVLPTSEATVPNRIPGLYAVVTPDTLGFAQGWTQVTGSLIGMQNSSTATFKNASVLTRAAISTCPGDTSAAGPICPTLPAFNADNARHEVATGFSTAEANNLTLTATPTVTLPNQNLAVTSFLATTNVPTGSTTATCLASQQNKLYISDNEGDQGGIPSNVGGVPFWESPDIFVVPVGAAAPKVTDFPADVELTAGADYNVYLRVHNEFGCSDVTAPISVFVDAADPSLGFANWQPVTAGSNLGQYATFGAAGTVIAPAFGAGIVGPFPWKPGNGGHKCLLAAIAASNETKPPASATAPVLPPAYGSSQIAQRNIQIGSSCTYSIANPNATSANLLLGISVTPATPVPASAGGPAISLVIGDPGGAWAAIWQGLPGLASVTSDGTNTTLVLNSSYVALTNVPLAGGQSPSVSIQITPVGTPPTVNVSAMVTDPETGSILQQNGGSCTGTEVVIEVPK
jgi:hypothetical protein